MLTRLPTSLLRRASIAVALSAALSLAPLASAAAAASTPAKAHDASAAVEKHDNGRFLKMHESFLARAKEGPIGLLFLGDSITERWTKAPEIWNKYYGALHPANFGIGGDQTQNVIWRIEHGELDGIDPRVVVLMLGTNNSATNTGEEIAAADAKIVSLIREKLPHAKVLLLAIFPRGPRHLPNGTFDDGVHRMEVIRDANARLAKLDDGRTVRFLDIGAKFVGADGKIPNEIMPDQLHPSPAGLQIWADAMQPTLEQMLKN